MNRLAAFTSFATLGALGTVQELAQAVMESIPGAEPEVVAEETLALVATATARAAETALRDAPDVAQHARDVLLELPFLYREYLPGGALLMQQDAALVDAHEAVRERLVRKRQFYALHLPEGQFPGERALTEKMALWMGRVSGPGLPERPDERLARLGLVEVLLTHLKLVLAYGRRQAG